MLTETKIIEKILTELKVIRDAGFEEPDSDNRPGIPSWISAGEGQSLIINGAISSHIYDLSGHLYTARSSLSHSISREDWTGIVKRIIGPLLGAIDLNDPTENSSETVLVGLNNQLDATDWNYDRRTFLFGCSLIEHDEIAPFVVGPVTIRSRANWLDHAVQEGRISAAMRRRLDARWSGKKIRRSDRARENRNEDNIFDAIGLAPYVCSVETEGLFGQFARDKALLAARLTLLGVGMMWARPSKALSEINLAYDGPPHRQSYAFFQERPEIFGGSAWVNTLHGKSLLGDPWKPLIAQYEDWWAILGETIQFLLNDVSWSKRPKLMNTFAHSLIWFHEACRERMPIIAIAKYMSSLDALACGGRKRGILELVSARLNVTPEQAVRPDGPSFKTVVDKLYSDARSRLLHGNSERLGHDWQDQRDLAESLARLCLVLCVEWAADHPECDDPKRMAQR